MTCIAVTCITDAAGRIAYSNTAYRRTYGYGDEIIGMDAARMVAPESATVVADTMSIIMDKGSWRGEHFAQFKDGSRFPVETTMFLLRTEQNKMQGMIGIVRDISQRKQQEADLRMFQALVENASDAIAVAHANDGTIHYINEAYRQMYRCGDKHIGQSR